MRMNAGLILGGQTPDLVGSMDRGFAAGRKRGLADLYREHGQGIAAGDQNALNALAGFDPTAAINVQGAQQDMRHADTRMGYAAENMDNTREDRATAKQDRMDAEQLRKTLAQTEKAIALMNSAQTPQQWDQIARMSAPELVGQFGNKQALLAKVMPIADVLKMELEAQQPPKPQSPEGKLAADVAAGLVTPKEDRPDFDLTQKLRKEFTSIPQVKAFSEQAQAYGRIVASAKDPSPAGDLALIFNFMKVLDPGSVVRESEFETAAQATAWLQRSEEMGISVPQPVASSIRKMASGQRLAPDQRIDFVNRAEALYDSADRGFKRLEDQYRALAERGNFNVEDVLIDFRYTPEGDTPPPVNLPVISDDQLTPEHRELLKKYGG